MYVWVHGRWHANNGNGHADEGVNIYTCAYTLIECRCMDAGTRKCYIDNVYKDEYREREREKYGYGYLAMLTWIVISGWYLGVGASVGVL